MKDLCKFLLIPFGLGLGAATAYRLSAEAMAVVVGVISAVVVCAVMGALTLVIVRAAAPRAPAESTVRNGYPPVVIVQAGTPAPVAHSQAGPWPAPYAWPAERSFSVIGDEDGG